MQPCLVWFRNDLRIHDHESLTLACHHAKDNGNGLVCLYVVDPHWFGKTRFGFPRTGPYRASFLRESLVDLDQSLRKLGGRLLVAYGDTTSVIPGVASQLGCDRVYCTHEVATEEKRIERRVRKYLSSESIDLRVSPANTLYALEDLPFALNELPEVFSKFRRKVEKRVDIRHPIASPSSLPTIESHDLPPNVFEVSDPRFAAIEELSTKNDPPEEPRAAIQFRGGESNGLTRIDQYFFQNDCLRVYKETRNGMLGADYSSKLSPWLAHGCLSPRRVHELVCNYEEERVANDSTYWLIFELIWRDYFSFVTAKHGPHLFRVRGLRQMELPWKVDQTRFDAWCEGMTGFPLIDANMRELSATGFMSNRGRQNVASFLTKNLGIDWRMGAEWFESMLIDYDPASNYGNWNYTAGIGNDARGFRWFNTMKQASMYDRNGDYVRHWLPELANVPKDYIHRPWEMHSAEQSRSGCTIGVHYPPPIVDLFQSADHHEDIYNRA
ncbi:MAG: DASH family cryptochrome [Planctomycetota bacterium]